MKILIAEDDPVSSRLLTYTLSRLGHDVTATGNGKEALAHFTEHQPPIIISDWMMPHMDGIELCQRVRSIVTEQYTFFILLTAKTGHANFLHAMEAGVDDFLTKPVSPDDLGTRLRVAERMILQREQAEKTIRLLARFPADNPNPVLQADRDLRLVYANDASLPLLSHWSCLPGGTVPTQLHELVAALFRSGERQEIEVNCADRVFSFSATSVAEGGITYLYGHDITDRKRAENELVVLKNQAEENALHDQLTGLPNRRLLTDRLAFELNRAQREQHKLALVVVDIDNFKQINDGFGHKVGDQVIVGVSQALRHTLRSTDTVCRWGGDEMVLLLADLKERTDVETVYAKIKAAVKKQVASMALDVPVSLSLGSAIYPDDGAEPALLMQQADHALYTAKADGRDCWREFKGFPKGHDARNRAELFIRLSAAVEEGRITTFFQPLVDVTAQTVVGAEALARWHDDQLGWVPPDVFIPLAEEKGLILSLGHQVLTQSLDQLMQWREKGHALTVSVNLSKRQILDADFCSRLRTMVHERNLKPEWVILEVTERQPIFGQTLGRRRLEELAAAGFRLSIDDFGSGYSSFDVVGEMPFNELKIHIGLVRRATLPRGRRIVQAIVEMAKTLDLVVVAEGVEDQFMQALLTAVGVNKLQGYLFSKPLPGEAFLNFVEKHLSHDSQRRAA